ncbi:MAG: hypothetical protein AAF614_14940 [Chloroflexota bacterium]
MKRSLKILGIVLVIGIVALLLKPTYAMLCDDHIAAGADLGIEAVPDSAGTAFQTAFCKYTKITAPNGQPIEFFAQAEVSNDQMVRARRILEFFLENVPESEYGADKTAVSNQMALNEAKLLLLNGRDDGTNPATYLGGQPLYAEEMLIEGSAGYLSTDFETYRDASFEEILHLMHDTGIGVDGPNSSPGAIPAYQADIRAATNNATSNNFHIWPRGADGSDPDIANWYQELAAENSLTQEYLASVIDSYYGYWAASGENAGGMYGLYIAQTRAEIATLDPMGQRLMEQYFNPYVTYMARIDPSFDGTFSLSFDPAQPYTHKSQYLLNGRLTGTNNANLTGNDQDNRLQGNAGNNVLDGKDGTDTAVFLGNKSDYAITTDGATTTVTDVSADRDGSDTLRNIEWLQFADQTSAIDNNANTVPLYLPIASR